MVMFGTLVGLAFVLCVSPEVGTDTDALLQVGFESSRREAQEIVPPVEELLPELRELAEEHYDARSDRLASYVSENLIRYLWRDETRSEAEARIRELLFEMERSGARFDGFWRSEIKSQLQVGVDDSLIDLIRRSQVGQALPTSSEEEVVYFASADEVFNMALVRNQCLPDEGAPEGMCFAFDFYSLSAFSRIKFEGERPKLSDEKTLALVKAAILRGEQVSVPGYFGSYYLHEDFFKENPKYRRLLLDIQKKNHTQLAQIEFTFEFTSDANQRTSQVREAFDFIADRLEAEGPLFSAVWSVDEKRIGHSLIFVGYRRNRKTHEVLSLVYADTNSTEVGEVRVDNLSSKIDRLAISDFPYPPASVQRWSY